MTKQPQRAPDAGWISGMLEWLKNLGRRRHHADLSVNTMTGGSPKLPPIADVLARAGREPRAPD